MSLYCSRYTKEKVRAKLVSAISLTSLRAEFESLWLPVLCLLDAEIKKSETKILIERKLINSKTKTKRK